MYLVEKFLNEKSKKYITTDKSYFIKEYKKNNKNKSYLTNELLCLKLEHTNLTKIVKYIETFESYFIFMKYYNCHDIITIYENNCSNDIENLYNSRQSIIKQLFNVTNYLHKNSIAHLDIKLDNILYDKKNNKVILCDFEYCTKCDKLGYSLKKLLNILGTKQYLAPEWFENKNLNTINLFDVDRWNIGIISYIILSKGNTKLIETFTFINDFIIKTNLIKDMNYDDNYQLLTLLLKRKPEDRIKQSKLFKLKFFK